MMMGRCVLVMGLVGLGTLTVQPSRATAWNPLSAAANKLKAVSASAGRVFGAPFVEATTQPTIRNVEDAGHRLISDADVAIAGQIERAGSVTSALVAQVNTSVAVQLDTIDHSLEARIVQVKTGLDDSVARSFGRVDQIVDRLDEVARIRIAQAGRELQHLLVALDKTVQDTLAKADEILNHRIADLRQLISGSIRQADRAAKARIDQLDEVAGKRLGSIDVIATKQGLQLEQTMIRVAALICILVFIAFVFRRLFAEIGAGWQLKPAARFATKLRLALHRGALQIVPQLVMALIGGGLLYYLAGALPRGAAARAEAQCNDHKLAFERAIDSLDLADARFHETQLEILEAGATQHYRGRLAKAELLHTVFTRPAKLQTLDGISDVMQQVTRVETMLGAQDDPELLIVKAFMLWQVGGTLDDEHEAAQLCAQAIEAYSRAPDSRFSLGPLAKSYLRAYLYHAAAPADLSRLRAALEVPTPLDAHNAFEHVIEYNRLVIELDRASTAGYLAMLSAHADLSRERARHKTGPESAAAQQARKARTAAAHDVVAAWAAFDAALQSSPWLADQPTALAAFTLDDSVLTRALYYVVKPSANELAPEMMAAAPTGKPAAKPSGDGALTPALRIAIAPVRVAWEQRYAPLLGIRGHDVLAFEESQRFKTFEQRATRFELAYVAFLVAVRADPKESAQPGPVMKLGQLGQLGQLATSAAERAAEMGLYRETAAGRVTEASLIVSALRDAGGTPGPDTQATIDAGYRLRHLRLL
jgi:hypothetical protein